MCQIALIGILKAIELEVLFMWEKVHYTVHSDRIFHPELVINA